MTNKLEKLFERLLSETDSYNATTAERAALHSAITPAKTAASEDSDATERLAAYLDGALEPEDAERFASSLAGAPDEVYELEAAQGFLDDIAVRREAAPADLVAAAAADAARQAPRRSARQRWFLNSASSLLIARRRSLPIRRSPLFLRGQQSKQVCALRLR